jgi:uncharacterized membrane protein
LSEYLMLILATIAFVGSHFWMSHSMRRNLVRRFGDGGFTVIYTVVSLALFFWMILEFGRAPKEASYWAVGDIVWAVASLLTLLAAVLFVGSLVRNPSLPGASENLAAQKPQGVFRVTRHPMMWGFALWGIAHILVAPRTDNFIFAGGIIFLALAGSKAQERKKARVIGVGWGTWLRQTSFFPRLTALGQIGPVPWVVGIALWGVATWAHVSLGGYPAGLFRWL